jgi:hypothetical protein
MLKHNTDPPSSVIITSKLIMHSAHNIKFLHSAAFSTMYYIVCFLVFISFIMPTMGSEKGFVCSRYPCKELPHDEGIEKWVSYQTLLSDDINYAAPQCGGQLPCNPYFLENHMTFKDSVDLYTRMTDLQNRRLKQWIRNTYTRLKIALQHSLNIGNIHASIPIYKEQPGDGSFPYDGCYDEGHFRPAFSRQWIDGLIPDNEYYINIANQVIKLFKEENNALVTVIKKTWSVDKPITIYYQITLLEYNNSSLDASSVENLSSALT